ncbi:amino acid adenylation domain-containing protein [Streptomyces laculatispora]|uniref:Amino acid adenylation domain-containing protein n=1 Tax=Streptomyces laculatispora TaxID=887464 RepID=A0ABY9ICG7_9ACTN|nr:amino acid adenylation domain-containing protein [Streptomyces laculatispora]WLQ44379.1 amino acid adenylation domain-containing protein [Streptomyces laculatispora]
MRCAHELFEEQVVLAPGATALIDGDERIDYAELDVRADRLAGLLAARGIRAGDTVGVYLERSTALVVTVLGILKAGAGYVMLDPGFPAERLRAMAEDARTAVVVSARGTAPDGLGVTQVHIEDAPGARPLPRGAVRVRPDDIACVMFTSGSTGRPKGIAASHHALTSTLTGQDFASFGPGAVWLQCAPLSWDAFALELWGPLMNGGTCVLHPGRRPEPFLMARLVAEHGITSMYLSASLFNVVVDEYPQVLEGLRELVVGGEALSAPHAARALEHSPGLRLSNGYGPVECMVFLTVHPVALAELGDGPVPIGRPLAGKRLFILDEELRPVPDGTTGEIYAAGAGLAREYRGRPALTAERFVAAPSGERVYRTGDLGRRRADGVLEYLGRADSQVKIRGFRVEPGEVESVLTRHPGIDRAAVLAHEHPAGDRQLTAYVVPRGGARQGFREAELREYARSVLADYLVPAVFVPLDALPLTPSGKLDRAALPEPGAGAAPAGRAAASGTVAALCDLFAQVLRAEAVGPDDDFFSLGGHSLLAARLLGRIRTVLGAEIDIRGLFEAPTPALLAPFVDTAPPAPPAAPAPGTASGALPVSHAQHRLWFLDRIGSGAAYNLPMLVRLRGAVDAAALGDALAEVADRHEVLRTVFEEADGAPVQRVLSGAAARPPLRVLRTAADSTDREIEREARHRFDLRSELPFRATLFTSQERPDEHALLVLVHHIAGDGWSLRPLFRDLSRAYAARVAGADAVLVPLAVPYGEHARQQLGRLGSPSDPHALAARQLTYWRKELDGLPDDGPLLPRRAGRPAVPGPAAEVVVCRLDAAAHARVVESARARGATLFMALHAALATVLVRAGADEDLAVGAPVAGRAGDGSVEDVVGFFVNMLVLRTDLSGDPTAAELLARVRETDLAAFSHQDVPFEDVVGALNPARSPGRQPFTDVVLALQNNARAEVTLPGAEHGVEVVRTGAARFELLVDVTDSSTADGAPDGLTLTFEYRGEALEADFVQWLAQALPQALEASAAGPETPLSRLGLTAPPRRAGQGDRITAPTRHRGTAERPMTALERETAAVWCEVLGVPSAGPHDDFFALGGNSLRAVRVVARLGAGRPVTVAQLFAAPTVAGFAAELERAAALPGPAAPTAIPRRPRVPRRPETQTQPQTQPSRKQEERQWTSV